MLCTSTSGPFKRLVLTKLQSWLVRRGAVLYIRSPVRTNLERWLVQRGEFTEEPEASRRAESTLIGRLSQERLRRTAWLHTDQSERRDLTNQSAERRLAVRSSSVLTEAKFSRNSSSDRYLRKTRPNLKIQLYFSSFIVTHISASMLSPKNWSKHASVSISNAITSLLHTQAVPVISVFIK